MKYFINISNHPSSKWGEKQLRAAREYGDLVINIPFPNVDPQAEESEIIDLAYGLVERVLAYNEPTVHIMGEMTLVCCVVYLLKRRGITSVASITNRIVEELPDGSKNVKFDFCRFREY